MDSDLLACEFDQPADLFNPASTLPDPTRRGIGKSPTYSLGQFAHALGETLAAHGIGIRLDETADGTRIASAWYLANPNGLHVIPIDLVPICPEQVEVVATLIKRNMALALAD